MANKTSIDSWLKNQPDMNINPYEDGCEPEKKEPEVRIPKPKGKAAGGASPEERKKSSEIRLKVPSDVFLKLKAMHFSRCLTDGDAQPFGAYVRHLVEQGIKAEPKEVRDMCRDLLNRC